MYIPKYFILEEYFSEYFFKTYYPRYGNLLWQVMDERVLIINDLIREEEGTLIMNTWYSDKMIKRFRRHEWRGYRDTTCIIGSKLSQHKYGRAADPVPLNTTAARIRRKIINDPLHYKYITCIEVDVPWIHHDCGNRVVGIKGIKLVKP